MTEPRRIAVFTSSRADLGPLASVIHALDRDPRVELIVVATGSHLLASHGNSLTDIAVSERSAIEVVDAELAGTDPDDLVRSFGAIAAGVSATLREHRTQMLVALGDRWELLAVAAACLLHAVPVAHLHGGETTEGAIDERVRHSVTKLADLHLCATQDSARRIRQLGEEPWRIVVTGAPGLDRFRDRRKVSLEHVAREIGADLTRPFGLVAYHPETVDRASAHERARAVLDATATSLGSAVVVYPGADPGASEVIDEIEAAARRHRNLVVRPHLGDLYVSAMSVADVLVGNSSSGICEAASFKLPVVDVGDRQRGRLRAENVVHASNDEAAVRAAIETALQPAFRDSLALLVNPYGDGHASERIVEALVAVDLDRLARKPLVEATEGAIELNDVLVRETATLRDAMIAIDRGACGIALVVDGGRRLIGTVSDGDIRRALLAGASLDSEVVDLATRVPLVASPDDDTTQVLALMQKNGLAAVPVLDDERVVVGLHAMKAIVGRLLDRP